jgi:hypothetical protein
MLAYHASPAVTPLSENVGPFLNRIIRKGISHLMFLTTVDFHDNPFTLCIKPESTKQLALPESAQEARFILFLVCSQDLCLNKP